MLWPSGFSSNRSGTSETLFGFVDAIRTIYRNQHPEDCSKSAFLIAATHGRYYIDVAPFFIIFTHNYMSFKGWGFGSEVHAYSATLGLAMNLDRVSKYYRCSIMI